MTDKMVVANWKMNGNLIQIRQLLHDFYQKRITSVDHGPVIVCPPAVYASFVINRLAELNWQLGGQDCSTQDNGAYTGDTSATMLKDIGCTHVIVGHSERRQHHQESNAVIAAKMDRAFAARLTPILCIGETLQQYQDQQTMAIISEQLSACLPASAESLDFIVAYEPVWSIGTGKIPEIPEIKSVHQHIHQFLNQRYANQRIPVLYGGSVNGQNSANIFAESEVDGVLVGGASLKVDDFCQIITSRQVSSN